MQNNHVANDFPVANAPIANDFPTSVPYAATQGNREGVPAVANDFPVAAAPSNGNVNVTNAPRVESVAFDYNPLERTNARPTSAPTSYPSDSDPYSGIVYEPQTTSSGTFAPGSAGIY